MTTASAKTDMNMKASRREPRFRTTRYGPTPLRSNDVFGAKIVGSPTAINGGIRWRYPIELGYRDMTVDEANGGTWHPIVTGTIYAWNEAEDMNTFTSGTGTIGTGNTSVAQADGTISSTSCKLKPLPNGAFVTVRLRGNGAHGQPHFTIINAMNSAQ